MTWMMIDSYWLTRSLRFSFPLNRHNGVRAVFSKRQRGRQAGECTHRFRGRALFGRCRWLPRVAPAAVNRATTFVAIELVLAQIGTIGPHTVKLHDLLQ